MGKIDEEYILNTCNFCGATYEDGKTDCFIMSQDGTLICSSCIVRCEAMLTDKKRDDINFKRFQALPSQDTTEKLRPVTRIPKRWIICDTQLYKTIPRVTACSPDGKKRENFSIPKQLAHWIISYDEKMDIDKLREDIKNELNNTVRSALLQ